MPTPRPDIGLASKLSDISRIDEIHRKALTKLGIRTVEDMLYHFPVRYSSTSEVRSISSLAKGEAAVVFGKLTNLSTSKGFRTKIPMAKGTLTDDTGSIQCVWFNQPYLAKMIHEDAIVRIEGKVSERRKENVAGKLYFSNPKVETVTKVPIGVGESLFGKESDVHALYPIYPESRGITSNWMQHTIDRILNSGIIDTLIDPLPQEVIEKYNLPSLRTALIWIHRPMKESDAVAARKRFAFEEVFMIQLQKRKDYIRSSKDPAFTITPSSQEMEAFIKRFPFEATEAQRKAISSILSDFKEGHPMSRLLEGDVGSGKTAVAASTVYAVTTEKPRGQNSGSLQTAYMCPTEILATQHFESFIKYFSYLNIQIALITGSGCRKFPSKLNPSGWTDISRSQLLKWVANGDIPIVIGTHALIQKAVKFKNLAYVIIDEQHRFGTAQRQKLTRKENEADFLPAQSSSAPKKAYPTKINPHAPTQPRTPHLLSMTATPIPRTLALTVYGDLDLTVIDSMPHGRKPIITNIVMPHQREATYEKIRSELRAGRQAYVICPRIDEADPTKEAAVNAKSVIEEAKRLKAKIFPEYSIGILHGKMSPAAKDKAMLDFNAGKTHILCATSVVEVGVNVPNATVIVIEGGERFGLAQLHQLRGRVVRGNHQAYCYVFADSKTDKTTKRLNALKTAKNGFELAEFDLAERGAGLLYSGRQWGMSDVAMEALKNVKMVEAARTEAHRLIDTDEHLTKHPDLATHLASLETKDKIHFE